MPLLSTAQIQGFVRELVNQPASVVDPLGVAADSQLAAFTGRPVASVGVRTTFAETAYTHKTHEGESKCYVRGFGVLELPVGPVVSVTSVSNDGVVLTEGTHFRLDGQARTLTLIDSSVEWSASWAGVVVVYRAGFTDVEDTAYGLYECLGRYAKWLHDRPARQGKQSASLGGASESYREPTVPDEILADLDALGLLLPRAKRRLKRARHRAGVPQPPSTGGVSS